MKAKQGKDFSEIVLTDNHPSQDQGLFPEIQDMIDPEDSFNMMDHGEMSYKMESMTGIVIDHDQSKELLRLLLLLLLDVSDITVGHATK